MSLPLFIHTRLNDYVLDVAGERTKPGTPVIAYPKKSVNYQNQLWTYSGDYIVSYLNGLVLTVDGDNNIVMEAMNPQIGDQQKWFMADGGFIVNQGTGLVLDVKGNNPEPRTPIIAYTRKNPPAPNQTWWVESSPSS